MTGSTVQSSLAAPFFQRVSGDRPNGTPARRPLLGADGKVTGALFVGVAKWVDRWVAVRSPPTFADGLQHPDVRYGIAALRSHDDRQRSLPQSFEVNHALTSKFHQLPSHLVA